jgi:biopolymer transport protein TolR
MQRPVSMVTEPNVVPMIDVLLVLLIIFMLSAMEIMRRSFDLYLPEPVTSPEPGAAPLVLTVTPGPTYVLNGTALPSTSLMASLSEVFRNRPEKILYVNADRRVSYQTVVNVFDAVRGAGVEVTAILPPSARK